MITESKKRQGKISSTVSKIYNTGTILYQSVHWSSSLTPEKSVSANNLFIVDFILQGSANVLTAIFWIEQIS